MSKLIIHKSYATIPNDLLNSKDISLEAKGMFAYLQSKPENRDFSVDRMAEQLMEWPESIESALKELENAWLLVRQISGGNDKE